MLIQHSQFVNLYNKDNTLFQQLFDGCTNATTLCNRIDSLSERWSDLGYTEQQGSAKVKGDLFEIFAEIFFKLNRTNNRVGIFGYEPINAVEDMGVDGKGIGIDGKPATVQVKFRSNLTEELNSDDLGQFAWQSVRNYGVPLTTTTNMVVFTSCKGLHWRTQKDMFSDSIRTINIDLICQHVDNNQPFWLGVAELIETTINFRYNNSTSYSKKSEVELQEYVRQQVARLNKHQKECFDHLKVKDKLLSALPTGAGKSMLAFVDILDRIVNSNESVFALASHRILLNDRHTVDMLNLMAPLLGQLGFIFVASAQFDTSRFQNQFAEALRQQRLAFSDIITTSTNGSDIRCKVEHHLSERRKVIIVSTYQSLDKIQNIPIDSMYCDEAHTMISDKGDSEFKKNYLAILPNIKNNYFLTATPRFSNEEDSDLFFMNNKDFFGEAIGPDFNTAVKEGYIVRPYIHVISPVDYEPSDDTSIEIQSRAKLIREAYKEHEDWLFSISAEPEEIGAKLLIKCRNVEDDMWPTFLSLRDTIPGVRIFAGASKGPLKADGSEDVNKCYIDGMPYSRTDYIEELTNLDSKQRVIVLHYDILSEGINVSGFTGVMFSGGVLSSETKILQNIGRCTRLHPKDRERLLAKLLGTDDFSKWVKPGCAVIIPFWDTKSEETKRSLVSLIVRLRREGFELTPVNVGTEDAIGETNEVEDEALNRPSRERRRAELEELFHQIEDILISNDDENKNPLVWWLGINGVNMDVNSSNEWNNFYSQNA
jgi:superfamily II DNA or RNA helicase